jgi:phospholipid/cholesterol/gamma-HCH transport system substrate-binding protein
MISRKNETIVGLFVVSSLVLLFIMAIILAQHEGLLAHTVHYQTMFKDVKGLQKGNDVRLSGVTIGSVTHTIVQPSGEILVKFKVKENQQKNIHEDAVATIGSVGLLGDRSLDITFGTPSKPPFPVGGMMASKEPVGFQDILDKAVSAMDDVKKAFANVAQMIDTINSGQGTLGKLVKDQDLYNHALQTIDNAKGFTNSLNKGTGTLPMIVHDKKFKDEIQKTMKNIGVAVSNVKQGSTPLSDALSKLPDIAAKAQSFATNLDKAGKGLPDLVDTGQNALSDVDQVAKGAKKMPLLRHFVPKPKERTIQVDREIK